MGYGVETAAVPQMLTARLPIGALCNQVGAIVKLVRVLMLGPVVLGLSFISGKLEPVETVISKTTLTSLLARAPRLVGVP